MVPSQTRLGNGERGGTGGHSLLRQIMGMTLFCCCQGQNDIEFIQKFCDWAGLF